MPAAATTEKPLPETLAAAHTLITELQWRVKQLEKQLYGPSAERATSPTLSKEQILLSLFPAAEPAATSTPVLEPAEAKERKPRQPAVTPRQLETVTERIEPAEKVCAHCGQDKCEIGCERSERFEYVPAKVIRHEIVRPKLACRCGQGGVSIAALPPQLLEQGKAGASVVAQVVLSKYDDHLPLYRQEAQFARIGVAFTRQNMAQWVERAAEYFQLVWRAMKWRLLAGDYLQVDETPVRVQDPDVSGRCATGWLWVAGVPGGDVIFEFHPGRGTEYAVELVGEFRGYLQRDGYGVYESLARSRPWLRSVGCWAHARRKFVEALEESAAVSVELFGQVRKLYLVEQRARELRLDAAGRKSFRQEHAAPLLQGLKPRLEAVLPTLLPQSPLGKAIRYTLAEWEPLNRFLEDGRLEIDNNLTENAIRPTAVGKKNWLFIGHPEAGWRSAVIYSIIVSCRRRGIDPWQYMNDVLARLPGMKQAELDSILPGNWQPAAKPA